MSEALASPASPMALFWACNWLALQGFGGVLPLAQRVLVERHRWVSRERFLELLSLSQVLPGPNIVNLLIMLGYQWFGWRGALASVSGILLAPLVLVLGLAVLAAHWRDQPMVAGGLRGMGVVAAALVLSTAAKLAPGLRGNPLGLAACVVFALLTALAIGWLRWPLVWVVLGLGLLACALAWWRLAKS